MTAGFKKASKRNKWLYSTRYDDYLWLMLLTGNVQSPWKKYNQYHDQHLLTAVTDFIRQQPWHWTCNVNENSQKLTDLNLRLVLVVLLDQRKSRGTCHWCPLSFYKKDHKMWSFAIYSRSFCLYRKWSRVRDVMITSYCK